MYLFDEKAKYFIFSSLNFIFRFYVMTKEFCNFSYTHVLINDFYSHNNSISKFILIIFFYTIHKFYNLEPDNYFSSFDLIYMSIFRGIIEVIEYFYFISMRY